MFHVVLFEPQIPQNTGNIGRMCAITKSSLHLIHPLGFTITDKNLKRSGMDYWKDLNVCEYLNWMNFINNQNRPKRLWLLTTKAKKTIWQADFQPLDGFIFGNETSGAPEFVHDYVADNRITIPQFDVNLRSLNLASSAAICVYEALRQNTQNVKV